MGRRTTLQALGNVQHGEIHAAPAQVRTVQGHHVERETRSVLSEDTRPNMLRIALICIAIAIIAAYFLYQSATAACLGVVRIGEPPVVICEVIYLPGVYK